MKWLLSVLFILVIILSCGPKTSVHLEHKAEVNPIGIYLEKYIYGESSLMEIRPDNRFVFSWQGGLLSGTTEGVWVQKGNYITFTSDSIPPKISADSIRIISQREYPSKTLKITLLDRYGEPLPLIGSIWKSDTVKKISRFSDWNGQFTLAKSGVPDTILLISQPLKYEVAADTAVSELEIMLIAEPFDYNRYFNDETWRIKGDSLFTRALQFYTGDSLFMLRIE